MVRAAGARVVGPCVEIVGVAEQKKSAGDSAIIIAAAMTAYLTAASLAKSIATGEFVRSNVGAAATMAR